MKSDVLHGLLLGAGIAFALAGILSAFATQALPPWKSPALRVEILTPTFGLACAIATIAASWELVSGFVHFFAFGDH